MTKNTFFNQMQSDIIGVDITTSELSETTALGAAMAAAIGIGLASVESYATESAGKATIYTPKTDGKTRSRNLQIWRDAVQRSKNWALENRGDSIVQH